MPSACVAYNGVTYLVASSLITLFSTKSHILLRSLLGANLTIIIIEYFLRISL